MRKKLLITVVGLFTLSFFILKITTPDHINASKVIDLVQNNYRSISVNDKHIEAATSNQYLIDSFIPKLARFTLNAYDGELPKKYTYKVHIKAKDGSEITLLDHNFLLVDNQNYEILDGTIDINTFYNVFMD